MKLKSYKIVDNGIWIPKDEVERLYKHYAKKEDNSSKNDIESGLSSASGDTRASSKARHIFQTILELF